MAILLNRETRVLVQGITTIEGRQNTNLMLEYKSEIVAGVSPGKYGQEIMGVPVYDKVSEAVKKHKIDMSVIFVPRSAVLSASIESINARIPIIVIITDDVHVTEIIKIKKLAEENGVMILGPGSSGILNPGTSKVGSISNEYTLKGNAGVITRTKGNENFICQSLFKEEIGESTIVSLGGGDIIGTGYIEILKMFENDDETEVIVIGCETKGRMEEDAARFIKGSRYSKPILAYIFDKEKNSEIAIEKEKIMWDAGVTVVDDIWEIGHLIEESTEE